MPGKRRVWTWEMRENLKFLVDEKGYPVAETSEVLKVTKTSLYKELKNGCPEDEYAKRIFKNYDPYASMVKDIVDEFGIESLAALREHFNKTKKNM